MSETTQTGGGDDQPSRDHAQEPAEGADDGAGPGADRAADNQPQSHTQDPAEGGDDSSATG
jgi:hypothetical protein